MYTAGRSLHELARPGRCCSTCMRGCSRSKLGLPPSSSVTISPSSTTSVLPSASAEPRELREARRGVVALAACRRAPGRPRRRRSRACRPTSSRTPSRSSSCGSVVGARREHRLAGLGGTGSRVGIVGRVHAVDHPLLAAVWSSEQHVAAPHPLAVEARPSPRRRATSRPRRCRCPTRSSTRRRTRPSGMSPSKSRYSIGWSSVRTARWFGFGSHRDALGHRPRRRARRRARAGGPSAARGRGAPARRSGARGRRARVRPRPPARACERSRASRRTR